MRGERYNGGGRHQDGDYEVETGRLSTCLEWLRGGRSILVRGGRRLGKTVLLEQLERALAASIANAVFVLAMNAWAMRRQGLGVRAYGKLLVQIGGGKAGNLIKRVAANDGTLAGKVDLGSTGMTDAHARMLAKALEGNTVVTALNLWDNSIGDAGVAALAAALKTNTRVTRLDLRYNQAITDAGGRALLDMLRANTAVRKIGLYDCEGMSEAVREEVARLAQDPARGGTATTPGE